MPAKSPALRRELRGSPFGLPFEALPIHRFDARKQPGVLSDGVVERGDFRPHFALHRLKLPGVHGRRPDVVNRIHAAERASRPLERHQRVVEGRGGRVGRDLVDLEQFLRHGGLQGRLEINHAHAVERRKSAVGPGPRSEQRIDLEGAAPNVVDPRAYLRIRRSLDHPFPSFERQMMQDRPIGDIGILEPLRRPRVEHADRGQPLDLANIVAVGQELRMFA